MYMYDKSTQYLSDKATGGHHLRDAADNNSDLKKRVQDPTASIYTDALVDALLK